MFSVALYLLVAVVVAKADASCTTETSKVCECARLTVTYGATTITCNQLLPKSSTASAPVVKFPNAEENANYIVVMVDPDAAPIGKGRGWNHWVMEVKGSTLKSGGKGSEKMTYAPPSPPSGIHNYIFFVVKKTKDKDVPNFGDSRANFDYDSFIEDQGIIVATNKFRVQA